MIRSHRPSLLHFDNHLIAAMTLETTRLAVDFGFASFSAGGGSPSVWISAFGMVAQAIFETDGMVIACDHCVGPDALWPEECGRVRHCAIFRS